MMTQTSRSLVNDQKRLFQKHRKSATKLILVLLMEVFFAISCGGEKSVPVKYQGDWVGENGTLLYMYADGKSGFNNGNKQITGGGAEFDESEKTLTISLFGVSETWKIDQEPDDRGEMILGGITFKRKN